MFKRILKESLREVAENPTLVRIAFLTGFVHTLWSFYRFVYTFYIVLEQNIEFSSIEGTILEYLKAIFELSKDKLSLGIVIFGIIFLFFGYIIAYPIGHGMMVSYVKDHSGGKAIKTGISRYFVTTITSGILGVVMFGGRHLSALRYLYTMGILGNRMILTIIILIGSFLLTCSFLYAYAHISCVNDDFESKSPSEQAQEALKNSSKIATENPRITIKFILLSFLLEIRFFVMATIVIAIPAFLVRIALQLGLIANNQAPIVVMVAIGLLLIASIYINSVIDAFFTAYWHKLYNELQQHAE